MTALPEVRAVYNINIQNGIPVPDTVLTAFVPGQPAMRRLVDGSGLPRSAAAPAAGFCGFTFTTDPPYPASEPARAFVYYFTT